RISKEINKIPSAKVFIYDGDAANQDFPISNSAEFIPGAEIEIYCGYHSEQVMIFKGIVVRQSLKIRNNQSPLLLIECKDPIYKLATVRKSNCFYDLRDSDIIEEILSANGLDSEIESSKITHECMVQHDSTDWDFIITRLEANGFF